MHIFIPLQLILWTGIYAGKVPGGLGHEDLSSDEDLSDIFGNMTSVISKDQCDSICNEMVKTALNQERLIHNAAVVALTARYEEKIARLETCDTPLKISHDGRCIIDWSPLEQFLPSNWTELDRLKDYRSIFVTNDGNWIGEIAYTGTLEQLKHAFRIIEYTDPTGTRSKQFLDMPSGDYGRSPILVCANDLTSGQSVEKIEYLLSKGANAEFVNPSGDTLVSVAARLGTLETLKYVIEKFDVIEETGSYNKTPVLNAAGDHWSVYAVQKLIFLQKSGANMNAKSSSGYNILHMAARYGTYEACQHTAELIQNGSVDFNLESENDYGKTALDYAKITKYDKERKVAYLAGQIMMELLS